MFTAIRNYLFRYRFCENGATAIEYGLIAAGISIGIFVILLLAGGSLRELYDAILNTLSLASGTV